MAGAGAQLRRGAAAPGPRAARLTRGHVGLTLFRQSWPMTVGLIATIGISIADTIYVGQLGPQQLAAMGFCFPVIFSVSAISVGLGTGAASLVGRAIGAGEHARVRDISTNALLLATLLVACVSAVGRMTIDPLFLLLGAPDDLLPYIEEYMSIWYLGIVFFAMPIVANGIIRATGDAIAPSIVMIAMAVLAASLSPVLVFGLFGMPRMEMAGAATANMIARGCASLAVLWLLHYRERLIDWSLNVFRTFFRDAAGLLAYGAPATAAQAIAPLSTAFLTHLLAAYGSDTVAAFAVGARVEALFLIPFWALQMGINPFIGQNIGAQQFHRVRDGVKWVWGFAVAWGLLAFAVLGTFGETVASVFTDRADIAALAAHYLALVTAGFVGAGAMLSAVAMFNPLGKPLLATAVIGLRFIGLYLPLGLVFAQYGGAEGVFAAACGSYLLAGAISIFLLRRAINALPAGSAATAPAPRDPPPHPHPATSADAPPETQPAE